MIKETRSAKTGVIDETAFRNGYPTKESAANLKDELLFLCAVQSYLWAMPALNMYAMKEGSEKTFGAGYNVLPIWKDRLNAKTRVTTPNSDVIYAMGYLNLQEDGPVVVEAPSGLQGILDDFFQRPLWSVGEIDGKRWSGDVGLPGPDRGNGGKYLLLPPDYSGDIPRGYYAYRSQTYGVFVFWRGFFQDPAQLDAPVKLMEQTRIYPLAAEQGAKPMQFPNASGIPVNMLAPRDSSAFDMLKRFIENEYVDPADMDMRGMLAAIGIVKGEPFSPTPHDRAILDAAARRASEFGRYSACVGMAELDGGLWYDDRRYVNGFPAFLTPEFLAPAAAPTYRHISARGGFFELAYSASPGMALSMPNVGAKYPTAFMDADGDFLIGERSYLMRLPPDIPVKLFWSVTLYDAENASGLDNGQPFPSINSMSKPATNADGSTDIYFGPRPPGEGKNWIATIPGRGFFAMLRLYGPTQAFYDRSWKPDDIVKVE